MSDAANVVEPSAVKPRIWLRFLRIAVSVFFGVLTVALCLLWVRSYKVSDIVLILVCGVDFRCAPVIGRIVLFKAETPIHTQLFAMDYGHHAVQVEAARQELDSLPSTLGISINRSPRGLAFVAPIWMLILLTTSLSIVPCRLRLVPVGFSLRTMFIATTLVAMVLGLAIWTHR